MGWQRGIQTVADIEGFFRSPITRGGRNDCMYRFKQIFEHRHVNDRVNLMQNYGQQQYITFVRDWGQRIDRKSTAGHFNTSAGVPMDLATMWQNNGRQWIIGFARGDHRASQVGRALRTYEGERLVASRQRSLAQLETGAAIQAWKATWEPVYRSRNLVVQVSGLSPGTSYPAPAHLLARWLIHRWDLIVQGTHAIVPALRTAGWLPNRASNQQYRDTLQRGATAIQSADQFFRGCFTAYSSAIQTLGHELVSYIYLHPQSSFQQRASTSWGLASVGRSAFQSRVTAWQTLNQGRNPVGLPPNGLPFPRTPMAPRAGVGGHHERINHIVNCVNYVQANPGRVPPNPDFNNAGLIGPGAGEGQGARIFRWF